MKKLLIAIAAATFSFAASAADQASDEYIGVAIGHARQTVDVFDTARSDNAVGKKINAGYRFGSRFGIELGYVSFGEGEISGNGARVSGKPKSLYGAFTVSALRRGPFDLYGKVGVASTSTEVSATYQGQSEQSDEKDVSPLLGVGAAYALTDEVSALVEYEHFGKVVDVDGVSLKAQMVSFGLRVSF